MFISDAAQGIKQFLADSWFCWLYCFVVCVLLRHFQMLLQFLLWLMHMPFMLNSSLSLIKYHPLMVTRVSFFIYFFCT